MPFLSDTASPEIVPEIALFEVINEKAPGADFPGASLF
jgi:hypothetical protein